MASRRKKQVANKPARGAKRAAKKRVAKRAAKQRPAKRRVVKRAAKQRPAKKRVVKRAAKQRPAKRLAAKRAPKRVAKKRSAKRPATKRVARRAAPRRVPPAFERQKAGASAKELLLFELQRARVAVQAAIQGLPAGLATRPVAAGKWSPLEIVLHLVVRDRARLEEFDRVLAGAPHSWKGEDAARQAEVNETHLAALRGMSWDDALRLLQRTRSELVSALIALPAEPAGVWTREHPFGTMMYGLPDHDRHHADQIRNARMAGG